MRRRLSAFGAFLVILGLGLLVGAPSTPSLEPVDAQSTVACDPDGVSVGYEFEFEDGAPPVGHVVKSLTVSDIHPDCADAAIEVAVFADDELLGAGSAAIDDTTVVIPLGAPVFARAVDRVSVQIAGEAVDPDPSGTPISTQPNPESPGGSPADDPETAPPSDLDGPATDLRVAPARCRDLDFSRVIIGTRRADLLIGRDGPDLILGRGGADSVRGGAGADCLVGGRGMDKLRGGEGDDVLIGGRGNDVLRGGPGNDSLFGGRGHDVLYSGRGNNRLYGGPGNDILIAGPGRNHLDGGSGFDTCYVKPNVDTYTKCNKVIFR